MGFIELVPKKGAFRPWSGNQSDTCRKASGLGVSLLTSYRCRWEPFLGLNHSQVLYDVWISLSLNVCFLERYAPRTLVWREAFCGIGLRSAKLGGEKGWKLHVRQESPPNPEDDQTLRLKITYSIVDICRQYVLVLAGDRWMVFSTIPRRKNKSKKWVFATLPS